MVLGKAQAEPVELPPPLPFPEPDGQVDGRFGAQGPGSEDLPDVDDAQAADLHVVAAELGRAAAQPPAGGPAQLNVIPGEARILVDIRTVPRQSHADIVAELQRLAANVQQRVRDHYRGYDRRLGIARVPALTVALEILTDRPCTRTERSDPVVRAAHWATQRATGREPVYGGVPGATDGTFLWAWKKIPIVTMGAGDREVPHQKDEWVDLEQLVETAKIYALTALHYLGAPAGK